MGETLVVTSILGIGFQDKVIRTLALVSRRTLVLIKHPSSC